MMVYSNLVQKIANKKTMKKNKLKLRIKRINQRNTHPNQHLLINTTEEEIIKRNNNKIRMNKMNMNKCATVGVILIQIKAVLIILKMRMIQMNIIWMIIISILNSLHSIRMFIHLHIHHMIHMNNNNYPNLILIHNLLFLIIFLLHNIHFLFINIILFIW